MASYMFGYKYLSAKDLAGFDKYKYKSIDNSPLAKYVMHPFWDQLVKVYPLWLPANVLTLTGWILSVLIFVVLSYYDPHFKSSSSSFIEEQTVPRWVWLLGAICIFLAHQFDGTDGKQARRTNSSSPLGELFDHGLDSSAVWLMTIGILSLFGISESTALEWEVYALMILILFAFFVAHWEKYNTGILFLPWAYDVSQIWLTGSYLFTFVYGTTVWKVSYFNNSLNIVMIFKYTLYFLTAVFCIPMSLYNQYQARKERPADCVSVTEGLMPIVSLGSVTCLFYLFGFVSSEDIITSQPRLMMMAYGIVYSNLTCRLIVTQMAGGVCERFNTLALPLIPMIIASHFKAANEKNMLIAYIIYLTICHVHYGVNVVRQLCDHLNVYCFKAGKPPAKKQENGHSNGISNGKID